MAQVLVQCALLVLVVGAFAWAQLPNDWGRFSLWTAAGLVGMLLSMAMGVWVAVQKGRREGEGAALGLLGPLGWFLEALLPGDGERRG